jgi:hypothetical protein
MTKAWVCVIGGVLAMIPIAFCTLNTGNFYYSLFFMALKFLLAEGWMSPSISMIQATASSKD